MVQRDRFFPGSIRGETPSEMMDKLVWLVNETPHIIPRRIGRVVDLSPAIIYSSDDNDLYRLHVGDSDDMLAPFPHEGIAARAAPLSERRISTVVVLTKAGIHLAVDYDRTKREGVLEHVRADLRDEADEIFVGGHSEFEDTDADLRTLCTTGMIRQAALYAKLGTINRLDREQTKLALGICISQIANGMPMRDLDVIEMAKLG